MKDKNVFFVLCGSMMFVSATRAMQLTARRVPKALFNVQKRNNSRPVEKDAVLLGYEVQVGSDSVFIYADETTKKLPEIYDNIKKLGAKKCANFSAEQVLKADACHSPICCGRAFLLGNQKNIQAAKGVHAIKDRFFLEVAKKGRVVYLQDIKERYTDVVRYRVMLNEFYGTTDRQKCLVLYSMIYYINACLFNQAQVILEDSFDNWKEEHFKMTPEIDSLRSIRVDINAWHENEQKYKDAIVDEQAKEDYRNALVRNRTMTYRLNRIDEEYRLLHSGNQTRE